jgi:sulfur carrier protein ThiS adenylyltransferase
VEAFDDAETKAMLINKLLTTTDDKIIISASGMAGYGNSNEITTRCINKRLYQIGDGIEPKDANGDLMAAKVAIAANHQANKVIELLLDK